MLRLILDDFTWQRPASRKKGFQWEGPQGDRSLARVHGAKFTPYRPPPGIFRDFAGLEPTPEAVLAFANRYGALRQRIGFDSFNLWQKGIRQMRQLVTLGDAVTDGDCKRISQALEPFLADPSLVTAADIRPIRRRYERGEKVPRDELAQAAVMRLYHGISPVERLEAEGAWHYPSGNVALRLKHADLLDFMFFQLGHALLSGRRFRQCVACGKWSLLQPGVSRADRTTCSAYCRLRLYRRRRARAVELHRRGWSPRRIAKEIGSDVSRVTRWLSQATE
jgi:hypothetical protein